MDPTSYLLLGQAASPFTAGVRLAATGSDSARSEIPHHLRQAAVDLANYRPEFSGTPVHRALVDLATVFTGATDEQLAEYGLALGDLAANPASGNLARSTAASAAVLVWTQLGASDLAGAAQERAVDLADAALADALRTYSRDPRPYHVLDAATARVEDVLGSGDLLGLEPSTAGRAALDAGLVQRWRNTAPVPRHERPSKDECEFVPRAKPGDLDAIWHHVRLLLDPGERVLWFVHSFERSTAVTTGRVVVFRKDLERPTRPDVRNDVPLWAVRDVDYGCEWMDYCVRFTDARSGATVKLNFKPDEWKAADICRRLRAISASSSVSAIGTPADLESATTRIAPLMST